MFFWSREKTETIEGGVKIALAREDRPKWKRGYTKRLDNRCVIEMEARCLFSWRDRSWSSTLTQPNGNRIYFDHDRIADKIIDPLLVPLVVAAVAEITSLDAAFMASDRTEFTDEGGVTWRKK